LDICGDSLVHEEKKTSINSEEKWKLFQCQFCDKKHYGKPELCMHNPSKHPEQNTRKNVKTRLPLEKPKNDGLRLGEETDPLDICDNNLESVHKVKKSDTKIGCVEKYKVFETQKLVNDNNIAIRFVSVNDGRKISDFQILGYHSHK
jgi:protein-arginine kinase activator protein McsA